MKTIYFVQGFMRSQEGRRSVLRGATPMQCKTSDEAIDKALRMSQGVSYVGVVAGAQDYDELTEEAGNFKLLVQYGDVPPIEE